MEGFTIVDGVVAAYVVVSALLAYSRGFVREAMAIAGWIGAAVLAFMFAPSVEPLVREIPVVGDFIGDSCELSIIAQSGPRPARACSRSRACSCPILSVAIWVSIFQSGRASMKAVKSASKASRVAGSDE